MDVQLQRRYDLVPNLVTTVQGCMRHESGVLERVCHLRSKPDMAVGQRAGEESGLSRSISRLFALAEAYPDLKASEGFRQLHGSLVRIETSRAPAPEQGLTVALSWPKGWVAEPPIRQKTRWFLSGNGAVIVLLVGLLAPLGWYL
ncbi:MAG TPA: LemA family protein [Xanthomonadales bacterium]|nr:LemA family protein [Xanthomonadales bacterium]